MSYAITLSALALAVAIAAVAVSITFAIRLRQSTRTCLHLQQRMLRCEATVKQSSPAELAATVAGLDASVSKLAKSHRSQFGTIHAKIQELEGLRAKDKSPGSNGERPSRDQLRSQLLRPPFQTG